MSLVYRWKTESQTLSDIARATCKIIDKYSSSDSYFKVFLCIKNFFKKEVETVSPFQRNIEPLLTDITNRICNES